MQISLEFVPINNKSALFQIMTWHQTDEKPLSEPKIAKFTNTYMSLGQDE